MASKSIDLRLVGHKFEKLHSPHELDKNNSAIQFRIKSIEHNLKQNILLNYPNKLIVLQQKKMPNRNSDHILNAEVHLKENLTFKKG